ncbi:MAG: DUF302 domain-containing protein [Deltaproteobacteria bacterium]|jgi:uncharacterized protein (DUF302 family)|nr:DUF302 domain-containing protein [Deltaproteobacteria bacterium]MDL1987868.1 DUF302 domain-containing protein [Deltaproteobacteria bacterium]
MYYVVNTDKTFEQASIDLESSVKSLGFGVLHVHDLGETLRNKGIDFKENCRVFEVCNPIQAAKVLSMDMRLNMALPCRISVFTEEGSTKIGLIKPAQMLAALSENPALLEVANEVEEKTIQMVNKAK